MFLPEKVSVIEVGPRDGFQNLSNYISAEDKIEIIKSLIEAGAKRIEATSFVNPKWVPQMKDASEVMQSIKHLNSDVELITLVPNERGALRAIASGADVINFVMSVSEAHNKANVNKTASESFLEFCNLLTAYPDATFRLSLATVFGCPFGEEISIDKVIDFIVKARQMGVKEILLADTIGIANPLQVEEILGRVKKAVGTENITLHMHDTRGLGLSNLLVAMNLGFNSFETSIGGLGGCPFAPGAAGNVATEDFINMLDGMGVKHSFEIKKLRDTLLILKSKIEDPLSSHLFGILMTSK